MLNLENLRSELAKELCCCEAKKIFEELQNDCPELNRFDNPMDIVEFLHDPAEDCGRKDRILICLLGEYRKGASPSFLSTLLLLSMWPALLQIFSERVKKAYYHDDLWCELQAAFFESLPIYPLDARPRKVALNLKLETLRALCSRFRERNDGMAAERVFMDRAAEACELFPEENNPWTTVCCAEAVEFEWDGESVEAARELLARLLDEGVITGADADLIFTTRVERMTLPDYAAGKDCGYEMLRKRRNRAEKSALVFLRKKYFS